MGLVKTYWVMIKSIGAYYRQYESDQANFEELNKFLTLVNQTNSNVRLLGDFTLPKVGLENLKPLRYKSVASQPFTGSALRH